MERHKLLLIESDVACDRKKDASGKISIFVDPFWVCNSHRQYAPAVQIVQAI